MTFQAMSSVVTIILIGCLQTAASFRLYVVGGTEVVVGSRPYQATINYYGSYTCGGALISGRHVLTASHCLGYPAEYYTVTLGMHDLAREKGRPIDYHVAEINRHGSADLAVVELTSDADLDQTYIWTVLLAPPDDYNYVGSDCYISGYGFTTGSGPAADRLLEAKIDVISNSNCRLYWGSMVTEEHMCAMDEEGHDVSICNGDSGGPLSCIRDGRWHVVGVASEHTTGCSPNVPAIFVRVSEYYDWIQQIARF